MHRERDQSIKNHGAEQSPTPQVESADGRAQRPSSPLTLVFWRIAPVLFVVGLVILAFMPALAAGFVNWDDDDLIIKNPRIHAFASENLHWMLTTNYAGHFQPLTWLSYSFDYAMWEWNPFGYHLTNVLLHALSAVLFYYIARRLLTARDANGSDLPGAPDDGRSRSACLAAALAATVFAVHPLRVESVAWLAERRDVLSGVFWMATVLCYLKFAGPATCRQPHDTTEAVSPRRWMWYVASVVLCVLSLTAKATAMTIAGVLIVLDVFPLGRLGGGWGWWRRVRRVWFEKVPFLLLGLFAAGLAWIAQREGGLVQSLEQHDIFARMAQACHGLCFYVWKTVWPTRLGPLYEIPPRQELLAAPLVGYVVVILFVVAVAFRLRKRVPALAAALIVFAIVIAPVLGFAQSGPQLVADRYSYLSCLGFAILAGGGLRYFVRSAYMHRHHAARPALALVVAVVITALTHATFTQAAIWDSPLSLWMHGVRISPRSSTAHVNYADALAQVGEYQAAFGEYQRGLAINPSDAIAHQHLAQLHRIGSNPKRAIEHFQRALALDPVRPGASRDLAEVLLGRERAAEAVEVLRAAVVANGRDLDAADFLADLLATHPDPLIRNGQESVLLASRVNRAHRGRNPWTLNTLAAALAEAGRFKEAVQTASAALDIATARGRTGLAQELRERLDLYRRNEPYHFTAE